MYGGSVCAILNAGGRKGPVNVIFERKFNVYIYVSE